jgi:hypothetical protein
MHQDTIISSFPGSSGWRTLGPAAMHTSNITPWTGLGPYCSQLKRTYIVLKRLLFMFLTLGFTYYLGFHVEEGN